ncbi:uncharacterized protein LOC131989882 isoform X2 [Centropristis striata]|nr:uncharacterized protein LOC131989882 isoform X2 [Centropristis striata]
MFDVTLPPSLVIDGKPNSNYLDLSCTSTDYQDDPWWRVDLGGPYQISLVEVIRRSDSSPDLDGAEIHIGSSLENNGNNNPRCETITVTQEDVMTFHCRQMSGRYVNIFRPGVNTRLQLCEVKVYGVSKAITANVALGGEATQSSMFDFTLPPSLVIDGKPNSNYLDLSCTSTDYQDDPWWRVDLGGPYQISLVEVIRRSDSSPDLDGAEIRIGSSLKNNGNNNPRCETITVTQEDVMTFHCRQMSGRYVNIFRPGVNTRLQLCEVKVYGVSKSAGANVALGGEATQSSMFDFTLPPSLVIDGKPDAHYDDFICTSTDYQDDPWWRVDLGAPYQISLVHVMRRKDCCASELKGAEIRIGYSLNNNGNNNPRCAVIKVTSEVVMAFHCSKFSGRYVNIYLPKVNRRLQLCEVKVYGASKATGANVALGGEATQSSVFDVKFPPSLVIDGKPDAHYSDGNCSATQSEDNPWWRVDLGGPYQISVVEVVAINCCDGAEIRIGSSLENNGNNNPRCAVMTVTSEAVMAFRCSQMMGRYVTIVLPAEDAQLRLCEVRVYPAVKAKADLKKITVVRFRTNFDMSDPNVQQQIVSQMKAQMEKKGISDFKIHLGKSFKQGKDSKTTECEPREEEEILG